MKRRLVISSVGLVVSCLIWGSGTVNASTPLSRATLFLIYNSWTESSASLGAVDDELSEAVFGIRVLQELTPHLSAEVRGTFSRTDYQDPAGSESNLSGLNDTQLKLSLYPYVNRAVRASMLLNVPTGQTALTEDEYRIALGIADNSRRFVVRRPGQGLDVGGELSWQPQFDNIQLNIGAGYIQKGGYQVLAANDGEYQFGDEFLGHAAVKLVPEPLGVQIATELRTYSEDTFDDESVYRSGNALLLVGTIMYRAQMSLTATGGLITRGSAEIADGAELVQEDDNSSRDEVFLDVLGIVPLAERTRAVLRGEWRSLTESELDRSSTRFQPKAQTIGIGGGVAHQFAPAISASLIGTYYTGTIDTDNDLSGLGITAAMSIRY